MIKSTYLERSRIRNANGKVREHRQRLVHVWPPEREVVRDLMYGEEQVVVGRAANYICREEEERREGTRVTEEDSERDL